MTPNTLRVGGPAYVKPIDADWICDVLEPLRTLIFDRYLQTPPELPKGVFGQRDGPGIGDSFEPRGDVNAIAH
jgi:hypothetical protein